MKFMFDWGSGTCVWSTNDAARNKYGYFVEISALPISAELSQFLYKLCAEHDKALDWKCPSNDLLWSEREIELFSKEARNGYEKLCKELGEEYKVVIWFENNKYPFI